MEISNSRMLINIDMFFDYVPFFSTMSNLVNIFQKCVVIPFISDEYLKESHYFSYIKDKEYLRCIFLLVPILGNLVVIGVDSTSNRRDLEELNDNLEILAEETLKNIELREKNIELKGILSNLKGERRALLKVLNQANIKRSREFYGPFDLNQRGLGLEN